MAAVVVLAIALAFVELHSPDGQTIAVNPGEISSLRDSRQVHFHEGVNCVIVMANRNFIGVAESCDVVRREIVNGDRQGPCTLVCGEAPRREAK